MFLLFCQYMFCTWCWIPVLSPFSEHWSWWYGQLFSTTVLDLISGICPCPANSYPVFYWGPKIHSYLWFMSGVSTPVYDIPRNNFVQVEWEASFYYRGRSSGAGVNWYNPMSSNDSLHRLGGLFFGFDGSGTILFLPSVFSVSFLEYLFLSLSVLTFLFYSLMCCFLFFCKVFITFK